ncbi:hypothetical protein C0995_003445 [Termitomyces sp. Mi166|nr:hypothetical protein C0995_003445 [Termitomyces sp. Mi166\
MAEEQEISPLMVVSVLFLCHWEADSNSSFMTTWIKRTKLQALPTLLPLSKAPSAQEKTLRGKGKGKEKALAMVEVEGEFSLLTKWTPELLAQLLPKLTDVVEDEGLEGSEVILAGNKANITLASCKKQEQIHQQHSMCDQCIAENTAKSCWYPSGNRPCFWCYTKAKECLWKGVE